ncbi:MAG: DEAD/DEAH box helicase [Mariprofundaceae bacterium]
MSTDSETSNTTPPLAFSDLGLPDSILASIKEIGYETPSPIQAEIIPHVMEGRDVIGQAQTGTGKTAAFALPILSNIDLSLRDPQVLVLAPTRELAIQVAEAFQKYAHHLKGFHVLPIYGGQSYDTQLRQLKRGVHVIVGTPGRVMDHIRRKTLKLGNLTTLVLDEADEMLRMGFIDDVKWILEQTPDTRQIALFSATMPPIIRKIAESHLNNPKQITIKTKTATTETINQRYWIVSGRNKIDALTRILEAETFDGILVFVRTRNATVEVAEKLEARGYSASALNGDIQQSQREKIVDRLKKGKIDIVVATDVAARGLDVKRISHVINYDVPHDTESYVHRIGRTGRAGRTGDAILFITPREKRMLQSIERATKQKVTMLEMPSTEDINNKRIADFKQRITDTLEKGNMDLFTQIIEQYTQEHNTPAVEVAAALAKLSQGNTALLLKDQPQHEREPRRERDNDDRPRRDRGDRGDRGGEERPRRNRSTSDEGGRPPEHGKERFRLEVGESHGAQAGNIVGALANEIGMDVEFIGKVRIFDDYSTIELPEGMPKPVFEALQNVRVAGQKLDITKISSPSGGERGGRDDKRKRSFGNKSPRRGGSDDKGGRGKRRFKK